jgi:stress-induced morphogen
MRAVQRCRAPALHLRAAVPKAVTLFPTAAGSLLLLPARRLHASARVMAAPAAAPCGPVQALLVERLTSAFSPVHLEIENESAKHSVPPGSESHFKVFVVSAAFDGVALLQRHRMVNDAVKGAGGGASLPVHALSIQAKSPSQWAAGAVLQSTPNCRGGSVGDAAPPAGAAPR